MKGWHNEQYRHSLAARGIKTSLAIKGFPELRKQQILNELGLNPRLRHKMEHSVKNIVAIPKEHSLIISKIEDGRESAVGSVVGQGHVQGNISEATYKKYRDAVDEAKLALAGSSEDFSSWIRNHSRFYEAIPGNSLEEKELYLKYSVPRTIYLGAEEPEVLIDSNIEDQLMHLKMLKNLSSLDERNEALIGALKHEARHLGDVRKGSVKLFRKSRTDAQSAAWSPGSDLGNIDIYYLSGHELAAMVETKNLSPEHQKYVNDLLKNPKVRELLVKYYSELQETQPLMEKSRIWESDKSPEEFEAFYEPTEEESAAKLRYLE